MGPEVLFTGVGLAALIAKFTDFFRLLSNFASQKSAIVTQLFAWAAGVLGAQLFAHSDLGGGIAIGDHTLASLNGPSQLILGLGAASIASWVVDIKQAIDGNDSAVKPPMLKG